MHEHSPPKAICDFDLQAAGVPEGVVAEIDMTETFDRTRVLATCSGLLAAELTYPFGDATAVFKVAGKVFAVVSLDDSPGRVTLKCDPGLGAALVVRYDEVSPGYHMNKRHWVTVDLREGLPASLVAELIADSYGLVVAAMPARARPPSNLP